MDCRTRSQTVHNNDIHPHQEVVSCPTTINEILYGIVTLEESCICTTTFKICGQENKFNEMVKYSGADQQDYIVNSNICRDISFLGHEFEMDQSVFVSRAR